MSADYFKITWRRSTVYLMLQVHVSFLQNKIHVDEIKSENSKTNPKQIPSMFGSKFWPITQKIAIMFLSFNNLEWIL